jgi:hypothetical protein
MLKDYVTKIQDLEAELLHFKSSRTCPPASRPLSSTTLDLAQSIAATDFGSIATDVLPPGKFITIRCPCLIFLDLLVFNKLSRV